MTFFKKRICKDCGCEYAPTATTQKFCIKCGKENRKKLVNKAVKKFNLKMKYGGKG